ncbi:MAG: YecH family metal-binding protein [Lysobacterales bacterium]
MNEIHAHEVMHMMLEQGGGFSRESLAQAIIDRFGVDAKFYACSMDAMDIQAVINFLQSRGKFVAGDDGFNTAADRICTH